MKITPISPHVYAVAESSPATIHTVDMRAFARNGSCTCPVFQGCCRFLLKHQTIDKPWRCPHILAVIQWIHDNEYWPLIDRTEKIIELPTNERDMRDLRG